MYGCFVKMQIIFAKNAKIHQTFVAEVCELGE